MVAIGVLIFLTLGLLCDVMNLEDGAFWKSVIDGFGPLKSLMKPLLKYAKFLVTHQIPFFKSPPQPWVLSTTKEVLTAGSLFSVEIHPLTKGMGTSVKGIELLPDQEVKFLIKLKNVKVSFYNVIGYTRIDFDRISESLVYIPEIRAENAIEFEIVFHLPKTLHPGSHEMILNLEAYIRLDPI